MYILFDVGGSKIRVAGARNFDSFENLKTAENPKGFKEGMEKMISLIKEVSGEEKIDAIVGGTAGSYSQKEKKLFASPNMKGWVNKPFGKTLEDEFEAPVHIDNDTAMAVIGETFRGEGKGYRIVAYITISTGLGGSRAVDGKVDERAITYEPGHQIFLINGEYKTLEDLVSGRGVRERFGKTPREITDKKVWDELAEYLGIGVYNTIMHWSPEIMILGGPMIVGDPAIPLEKVKKKVRELLTMFPEPPEIVKSTLGDENGLYGALEYIRMQESLQ